MAFKDWFKSDAERLGRSVPSLLGPEIPASAPAVSHDAERAQRLMDRLPRGADVIRDQIDRKERARWARAHEIAAFGYEPGNVLLPAPVDPDQSFRLIPIAVSDRSRSPIPGDPDQRHESVD